MSFSLSIFAGAGWQFFDNNGTILSGGKLHTYNAGSTTSLTTYTNSSGSVANANPIILDSAGRVPNEIWTDNSVFAKFILKDSNDVLIGTWDNIPSLVSSLNLSGTNNGVVYFNSVGTFTSGSNLTFDGSNLSASGSITAGSNLYAAGDSVLSSNVTVGGGLIVSGALTVNGATTLATGATLTASPDISDNSTKIATTEFVKNTGLGWEQSWQGFSASPTVPYTNITGKPYCISIKIWADAGASGFATLNIGGLEIAKVGGDGESGAQPFYTMFGIVPPNHSWDFDINFTSGQNWEARYLSI